MEGKARLAQWLVVPLFSFLTLLFIALGALLVSQGTASPVLLAFLVVYGLAFLWIAYRAALVRLPTSDFSMAEKVIFELESLERACERYNDSLAHPKERRRAVYVCRRHAAYLLTTVSRFSSASDEDQTSTSALNLFVGELSSFADRIATLSKLVGGLVAEGKPVPEVVVAGLDELRGAVQTEWSRLGQTHTEPLEAAIAAAEKVGVSADMMLTASPGQLALRRIRVWRTSLSALERLVILVLVASVFFGAFLVASSAFGHLFTYQDIILDFLTFMLLVVGAWAGLRLR